MTVSGIVITKNERRHIGECLARLHWADELLVLDSFSDDDTVTIAERAGALVHQHEFSSFPRQRNVALSLASGDWVFFVDADERVSEDLGAEVREVTGSAGVDVAGYWVPRRNIICGRWIRHGGWYPDYQLRLLRRGYATYDEQREVHELVKLDGAAGHLANTLVHYNYQRWAQFLAKQRTYAALEARSMCGHGIRPRPHNYVLQPLREMRRRYFQLGGYRDGWHGLVLASLLGYYTLVAYCKLGDLWRAGTTGD